MNVKDLFPHSSECEREPANLVMRLYLLAPVCASRSASKKKRGKENIGALRHAKCQAVQQCNNRPEYYMMWNECDKAHTRGELYNLFTLDIFAIGGST